MKIKDVYDLTSESFVMVKESRDAPPVEYYGQEEFSNKEVYHITATKYPMYDSVIEVETFKRNW